MAGRLMARVRASAILILVAAGVAGCATPITPIERIVEARSFEDIAKDNEIVLRVNNVMARLGTIKASTEIYEQRLLITGLFEDEALFDQFRREVDAIAGIRTLYWHVALLSEAEQERRASELIGWTEALALDTRIGAGLYGTRGISESNLRVAVDAFGSVYLLGRARSQEEHTRMIRVAQETRGARKVVDYIVVRP